MIFNNFICYTLNYFCFGIRLTNILGFQRIRCFFCSINFIEHFLSCELEIKKSFTLCNLQKLKYFIELSLK